MKPKTALIALSVAPLLAVGIVPTSAAAATCSGSSVAAEQLESGCSLAPGTELVVDGRSFDVPAMDTFVVSSHVVASGAADVPDVLIANTASGVSVEVGDGIQYGTAAAVSSAQQTLTRLNRSESTDLQRGSVQASVACSSSYKLTGASWGNRSVNWRYNSTGSKATYALSALQSAAGKWGGTISACGTTKISSAKNSYLGSTSTAANITSSGGCGANDSKNVVSWGSLPTNTLAVTCWWFNSYGDTLAADQRYTTNENWSSTSTCSGSRYDMQGVATHEWGHSYGLDHVAQSTGLVMKPASNYCETTQRSLGKGDVLGIAVRYS